jgi:hypothetical protein
MSDDLLFIEKTRVRVVQGENGQRVLDSYELCVPFTAYYGGIKNYCAVYHDHGFVVLLLLKNDWSNYRVFQIDQTGSKEIFSFAFVTSHDINIQATFLPDQSLPLLFVATMTEGMFMINPNTAYRVAYRVHPEIHVFHTDLYEFYHDTCRHWSIVKDNDTKTADYKLVQNNTLSTFGNVYQQDDAIEFQNELYCVFFCTQTFCVRGFPMRTGPPVPYNKFSGIRMVSTVVQWPALSRSVLDVFPKSVQDKYFKHVDGVGLSFRKGVWYRSSTKVFQVVFYFPGNMTSSQRLFHIFSLPAL